MEDGHSSTWWMVDIGPDHQVCFLLWDLDLSRSNLSQMTFFMTIFQNGILGLVIKLETVCDFFYDRHKSY